MPGDSGHYQSDEKKSGSDGGHHIPHEARVPGREPGWPAPHEKEEEPCLETVAPTSQMERRVAVMVATTYPMKPGSLGKNLGGLHLMKRRKGHAWRQWPPPVRWKEEWQ